MFEYRIFVNFISLTGLMINSLTISPTDPGSLRESGKRLSGSFVYYVIMMKIRWIHRALKIAHCNAALKRIPNIVTYKTKNDTSKALRFCSWCSFVKNINELCCWTGEKYIFWTDLLCKLRQILRRKYFFTITIFRLLTCFSSLEVDVAFCLL